MRRRLTAELIRYDRACWSFITERRAQFSRPSLAVTSAIRHQGADAVVRLIALNIPTDYSAYLAHRRRQRSDRLGAVDRSPFPCRDRPIRGLPFVPSLPSLLLLLFPISSLSGTLSLSSSIPSLCHLFPVAWSPTPVPPFSRLPVAISRGHLWAQSAMDDLWMQGGYCCRSIGDEARFLSGSESKPSLSDKSR